MATILPLPSTRASDLAPSPWSRWPEHPILLREWNVDWVVRDWQLPAIAADYGHCEIPVRIIGSPSLVGALDNRAASAGTARLEDILSVMANNGSATPVESEETESSEWYFVWTALDHIPQLASHATPPSHVAGGQPAVANLWMGMRGQTSVLHWDLTPNWNVQLNGAKEFTLFAPDQKAFLYWDGYPGFTTCRVDPHRPDARAFPEYTRAMGYRCVLRPRDSIFIPPHWSHQVRYLEPLAVNVNFWFPAAPDATNVSS